MKWIELQHDEDKPSRVAEYTDDDVGCYFDGAFGFEHNAKRLLDFAEQHGFSYDMVMKDDNDRPDLDDLVWLTDSALDWLNENTLRPPFIEGEREYYLNWAWEDGDFGLWKYDWDGELV
jgi:hypothetical protein